MAYQALVCTLSRVMKHPNADRLQLADVQGFQVIVGLDRTDGDLGIFFPSDGQLSHEFCEQNRLYRKHPHTGEKMDGFFESNCRVRSIKLRGEYSEGFWIPIDSVSYCGSHKLKAGDLFTEVNGHKICQKYFTPATRRAMRKTSASKKRVAIKYPTFHEHYDTKQLRHHISMIPHGSIVYITEKLHGSSGRSGCHKCVVSRKFWDRIREWWKPSDPYSYVSGTRRVVLQDGGEDGFYTGTTFRSTIHAIFKNHPLGLHPGETIYYEIVGYQDKMKPLMGTYHTQDPDVVAEYGENIVFQYGCDPNGIGLGSLYRIFVYRMTQVRDDGDMLEYSWPQIQARCRQLGLVTVPVLDSFFLESHDQIVDRCRVLTQGCSTLDTSHPIEGVVVRVEHEKLWDAFKYKGDAYCDLEGIRKNDLSYVDPEDVV